MTTTQKEKLSWLLADLCAVSVQLGKVRFPRSDAFRDKSIIQDKHFDRVMNYVDEIVN